jgi:predicted O-methyltransferase YrrM
MIKLTGTKDKITANMLDICPIARVAMANVSHIKGQLIPYQAMALYYLASGYNFSGAQILEIGTLAGYSAAIISQAAMKAHITTLNPVTHEVEIARGNLAKFKNVKQVESYSWDYLKNYSGAQLDMIFVDGDHNRIARDLPWFSYLKEGGLMIFHDYCKEKSGVVYGVLNATANKYEHPFDVYLMDTEGNGMVGFVKRDGEVWG